MEKYEFKAGDKVVCVKGSYWPKLEVGKIYKVREVRVFCGIDKLLINRLKTEFYPFHFVPISYILKD